MADGEGTSNLLWLSAAVCLSVAFTVPLLAMLAAMHFPKSAGRLRRNCARGARLCSPLDFLPAVRGLATAYPWIKAAHIVGVVAWMAGLLYLPRLSLMTVLSSGIYFLWRLALPRRAAGGIGGPKEMVPHGIPHKTRADPIIRQGEGANCFQHRPMPR
jgi:hypothetical protein